MPSTMTNTPFVTVASHCCFEYHTALTCIIDNTTDIINANATRAVLGAVDAINIQLLLKVNTVIISIN